MKNSNKKRSLNFMQQAKLAEDIINKLQKKVPDCSAEGVYQQATIEVVLGMVNVYFFGR